MLNEMKIKKVDLENIKTLVSTLSPKQMQDLVAYLKSSYSIFDEHFKVKACKYCSSDKIVKNGTRNGHHKYICRACKRNFTYRTNSILSGIQKINKWNLFVEDFMRLNITPVRELKYKIGVSEQTIFNWRHKLLSALVNKKTTFSNEVIEFDDAFFMISRKGRQNMGIDNMYSYRHWRKGQVGESKYNTKVFVTYGRSSKKLEMYLSNMGRVRKTDLKKILHT